MGHGGRRPGAGRKPGTKLAGTIEKEEARKALRAMVIAELEPMTKAQMGAAKGLTVAVVRRKDGTWRRIDSPEAFDQAAAAGELIELTTLQPSTAAYTDLLNRALDKPVEPKQEHEHHGEFIFRWET